MRVYKYASLAMLAGLLSNGAFAVSLKPSEVKNKVLDENVLSQDPMIAFDAWLKDAQKRDSIAAKAFGLATVRADMSGQTMPVSRIMTYKGHDANGFHVVGSSEGMSAQDIARNSNVAMTFYWPNSQRQVVVMGKAVKMTADEAATYFTKRMRESQITSHAVHQSHEIGSRQELDKKYQDAAKAHPEKVIAAPASWQGWHIVPTSVEFWQAGPHALHDRILFTKTAEGWSKKRLQP